MSTRASKSKRRSKTLPALGVAGVALSLASGANASNSEATTNIPSTSQSHEILLGEEEISDVSLATFYVFDKENAGAPQLAQHLRLAGAGSAGCGGCGGCGCARAGVGGCGSVHVGCSGCRVACRGCRCGGFFFGGCGGCTACGGCSGPCWIWTPTRGWVYFCWSESKPPAAEVSRVASEQSAQTAKAAIVAQSSQKVGKEH